MVTTSEVLAFLKKPKRYLKLETLNETVSASINGVFDSYLRRVVARKQLKREQLENPDIVQTFVNEMVLLGRMRHPGILPVFDAVLGEQGEPAYIMPVAEGQNLAEYMQVDPRTGDCSATSLSRAIHITRKISEALTYTHDQGVLNLDVKPANIMLGSYGEVTMIDWGSACVYDQSKYDTTYKSVTGDIRVGHLGVENKDLVMGTPMYMSPEQLQGNREGLQPTSDIFSVGVLLYQMLTGKLPYRASTLKDMVDKICNHQAPSVHQVDPDIPLCLSKMVDKMLEKKPADRYQSFVEVQQALDESQRSAVGYPTKTYAADEVIFKEGDPSDYICIVVSGQVEISVTSGKNKQVIATVEANEPFGELAALSGQPRTATAIAVEKSVIRIISRKEIATEVEKLSPWVGGIVSALTERLIEANTKLFINKAMGGN